MCESFAIALDRLSARDASERLASGLLDADFTTAETSVRWLWFAELLDSAWGLSGRLRATRQLDTAGLRCLEYISDLCRRQIPRTTLAAEWTTAADVADRAARHQQNVGTTAAYMALAAAHALALECLDAPPEGCDTAGFAFHALALAAPDDSTAREWIHQALDELDRCADIVPMSVRYPSGSDHLVDVIAS